MTKVCEELGLRFGRCKDDYKGYTQGEREDSSHFRSAQEGNEQQ